MEVPIFSNRIERFKKRRKRGVDYNAEIPFEKKPGQGNQMVIVLKDLLLTIVVPKGIMTPVERDQVQDFPIKFKTFISTNSKVQNFSNETLKFPQVQ